MCWLDCQHGKGSMTKLEKMADQLNEAFRDKLIQEMKKEFGIEVENNFNIFDMRLHTTRTDGKKFTAKQHAHLKAYSEGFGAAMSLVKQAAI
jgi:hypothetical protein